MTTSEPTRIDQTPRIVKRAVHAPESLGEAYDYPSRVSFTRAMHVELDNCVMLFVSGTASVNEAGHSIHQGDVPAQTRRAFTNIKSLLESEGLDWHDVVRTTCYLDDFRYYDAFNEVRNAFFDEQQLDPYPASTCVQARICRPELLVEIEAIAMAPKSRVRPR